MPTPPGRNISWFLLVVLGAALAVGAAASILVSASTTPPPSSGGASLVILPPWVLAVVAAAIVAAITAGLIYQRVSGDHSQEVGRYMVAVLVLILLMIVFVLGARFLGAGGPVPTTNGSPSAGGSNSTGTGNHSTYANGSGGQIVLFPSLPAWVPFVLLAGVVVLVAVVAIPETRRYLFERRQGAGGRSPSPTTAPEGVRAALARASTALEEGADPRAVILALYGEVLAQLTPMVGDIDARTPEEVRVDHLVRLRVRPEAATTLTRLFEEARYSVHPMGADAGARAREAVRATLDDLNRRSFTP